MEGGNLIDMAADIRIEKEDWFEDFFADISSVLEDLGQSGFRTVHDNTLQELKDKGDTALQFGMPHLSGLLLALQAELSHSRHSFSANTSPAKYYAELIRYIDLGKEKTAYDRGKNYYLGENAPIQS